MSRAGAALSAEGLRSTVAALRQARGDVARRRERAVREMSEAETDMHQLGRILVATDMVIAAWEAELAEHDKRAEAARRVVRAAPGETMQDDDVEKPCDVE